MASALPRVVQIGSIRSLIRVVLLLACVPISARAETIQVDSDVVGSVTWSSSNVYVVQSEVTVAPGAVLEVEPGTVVKFEMGAGLRVEGQLLSVGSPGHSISYTSIHDDNIGGDTSRDGPSLPRPGDWEGIAVLPVGRATWEHSDLWFGGTAETGMIDVIGSDPQLRNCRLRGGTIGISARGGADPTVEGTLIDACTSVPLAVTIDAVPQFDSLIFGSLQDNALDAIGLLEGILETDLTLAPREVAIGGATVTAVPYVLLGSITVASTATLTVEAGTIVKAERDGWVVDGRMDVLGSSNEPVVFTSVHDDDTGTPGDTNRNGSATAPAPGDWGGILVHGPGELNLSRCEIRYADSHGVRAGSFATARISDSAVEFCENALVLGDSTVVDVQRVRLAGCVSAPVVMYPLAEPLLAEVVLSGNGLEAVELLTEEIDRDGTIRPLQIGGNVLPYVVSNSLVVGRSSSLTIESGTVLKFQGPSAEIIVRGQLIAEADSSEAIVFTSIHDDCAGTPSDTRGDGWSHGPCYSDWGGLQFLASGVGSASRLDRCVVRFAGSGCRGAVHQNGGSVTISNSLFEYCLIAISSEHDVLPTLGKALTTSNTAFDGVLLSRLTRLGGTLTRDAVLRPISTPGGMYVLDRDLIIPFDVELEIEPETRILPVGAGVDVHGALRIVADLPSDGPPRGVFQPGGGTGSSGNPGGDPAAGLPTLISCGWVADCDLEAFDLSCLSGKSATTEYLWRGITFFDTSDDDRCVLQAQLLTGAERPIVTTNASPTLRHVWVSGGEDAAISIEGTSSPIVENCVLRDSEGVPLAVSLEASPSVTNLVAEQNRLNGVGLLSSSLAGDASLGPVPDWASALSAFVVLGDLLVTEGSTLTLEPATILKFMPETGLMVRGRLVTRGVLDPESLVVLTSVSDDSYGGDTNGDGATTGGSAAPWSGVEIAPVGKATPSSLENTLISYTSLETAGLTLAGRVSPSLRGVALRGHETAIRYEDSSGDPLAGDLQGCDFVENETAALNQAAIHTVSAEQCWWGHASGPFDPSDEGGTDGLYNPGGLGGFVGDGVDYEPWSTSANVPQLGDVSGNGSVSAHDAALILAHVAGSASLAPARQSLGDVDCSGELGSADAATILQFAARMTGTLPCLDPAYDAAATSGPVVSWVSLEEVALGATTSIVEVVWTSKADVRSGVITVESLPGSRIRSMQLVSSDGVADNANVRAGGTRAHLAFASAGPLAGRLGIEVEVEPGGHGFRIVGIEFDGEDVSALAVDGTPGADEPMQWALHAPHPNPFNPRTSIVFDVPSAGESFTSVALTIHDVSGRVVRHLLTGPLVPGRHERVWDGVDDRGRPVASGIYIARLVGESTRQSRKLTLIR